jgi:hypothetical protein
MTPDAALAPVIASHRFGLSQTSLASVGPDPRAWVMAQLRQPALFDAAGLPDSADAAAMTRNLLRLADPQSACATPTCSPCAGAGSTRSRRPRRCTSGG